MKKLSVLFAVLCIFVSGLSAKPSIPKNTSYDEKTDKNNPQKTFIYIDDSCQNIYRIYSVFNKDECKICMSNESLVTGIVMEFNMFHTNEKRLDKSIEYLEEDIFTEDETINLEKQFSENRNSFIWMYYKENPDFMTIDYINDKLGYIKKIIYNIYGD